jgi:radical SAM protein with 4Fe4S-binding SPASM domain
MELKHVLESISNTFLSLQGKKPKPAYTPYMVVWNFTNKCNLSCKHCYQDANTEGSSDELSLEEKLKLVDDLYEAGVKVPVFSGGEPLIHPDFFPVLEKMVNKGMHIGAASNGTIINEEMAERLKLKGLNYIEISLDSTHPEVHDEFRGHKGAWEKTVEGIKNCVEAGLFTGVAMTVTKNTMNEIDNMLDLTKELGAQRFIHFNFIPAGRGPKIIDQDLSPSDRENVLKKLSKRRRTAGFEVLSTSPQYARVCLQQSLGKSIDPNTLYVESRGSNTSQFYVESPSHYNLISNKKNAQIPVSAIKGCGAGRQFCCVQPNGDICACMFIPTWVFGNIRQRSFLEIWHKMIDQPCFSDREILEENCGSCQFRYICGGCRARAINSLDNPLSADTGCISNL